MYRDIRREALIDTNLLGSGVGVFVFLSVATVSFFSFVAIVVWSAQRRRERVAYYHSETVKKIAESQSGVGSAAIEFMRESERIGLRRRQEGHKLGGLVTIAVGVSMMIFMWAVDRQDPEPGYLFGLIPLFVGLALLAYAYFLGPKAENVKRNS